jgi:hypothetical protein
MVANSKILQSFPSLVEVKEISDNANAAKIALHERKVRILLDKIVHASNRQLIDIEKKIREFAAMGWDHALYFSGDYQSSVIPAFDHQVINRSAVFLKTLGYGVNISVEAANQWEDGQIERYFRLKMLISWK